MLTMDGVPAIAAVVLLAMVSAVLLSVGVGAVAWRRRDVAGATSFALAAASIAAWASCDLLGLLVPGVEASTALFSLSLVGGLVAPAAWLRFACLFTSRRWYRDGHALAALAVEPFAVLGAVVVAPRSLFSVRGVEPTLGLWPLVVDFTVLYWAHAVYAAVLGFVGVGLLLSYYVESPRLYRRQLLSLGLGVALPVAAVAAALVVPLRTVHPIALGLSLGSVPIVTSLVSDRTMDALARDEVLANVIEEGIAVLDHRDRVVEATDAVTEMVGQSTAEVRGRHLCEVVPEWPSLDGAGDPTAAVEGDFAADGGRQIHIQVTPVVEGAETVGRVAVFTDVTERARRVRQLRRSRERLEVFDRLLRHDLRNDLNVILGTADLLRDSPDDPDLVAERADTIERTGARLLSQAEKLRHVEWTLSGKQEVTAVELSEVVRGAAEWSRALHSEARVVTECPSEVWVAAPQALAAAVKNLVENAIEHNEGDATVSIRVIQSTDDVKLVVEDDGPGIPESELAVLRRGSETQLEHLSGLGLWLVQWVVDDAEGSIDYAVDEGGTRITLTLRPTTPATGSTR